MKSIATTVSEYNNAQKPAIQLICNCLALHIGKNLLKSESKIWHGTPVWFINENPIVSYSVRTNGAVSLMFFSGQSFDETDLKPGGKFKAAQIDYSNLNDIKITHLKRWLSKAKITQWDYKNIVKKKGVLQRIKFL